MNELSLFVGDLCFLCAKLARWCAVLIGLSGVAYGTLATALDREFVGLGASQLYLIGFIGPMVLFAVSVLYVAAGNFMQRSVTECEDA